MYQYLGNTGIKLYDFLGLLSFLPVLLFNLSQYKKKKLLLGKASRILLEQTGKHNQLHFENLIIIFEIIIVSLFQYAFIPKINSAFGSILDTGANYFGLLFINPLLFAFICLLLGINVFKQTDLITPAFPLALVLIKLACFCHGCCNGIECSFGLYNHDTGLVEFPVQLVEAGLALCIFVFLLFWRKKAKEGTIFPTYMIIYCVTRFFSEFFRSEPNVVWFFKVYHLLCILGIVVGIIELFIVKKHKDKITLYFNKFFDAYVTRLHNYALKNGIIKEKNIVHHEKRKKK